jgi:hypothetical protein
MIKRRFPLSQITLLVKNETETQISERSNGSMNDSHPCASRAYRPGDRDACNPVDDGIGERLLHAVARNRGADRDWIRLWRARLRPGSIGCSTPSASAWPKGPEWGKSCLSSAVATTVAQGRLERFACTARNSRSGGENGRLVKLSVLAHRLVGDASWLESPPASSHPGQNLAR